VDDRRWQRRLPLAVAVTSMPTEIRVELASDMTTLDTAVLWAAINYLIDTPRSLLRRCADPGCGRPFVGAKHGRYCATHTTATAVASRQRAAEARYRERKAKRGKTR
jgi:predicted RNA-binding Zn ribbon-like protein